MRLNRSLSVAMVVAAVSISVACSTGGADSSFTSSTGRTNGADASANPPGSFGSIGLGPDVPVDAATTAPACGDAVLESGETCDDGNVQPGDGCSSSCAVEPGYACRTSGAACDAAACGDGIVAGTEDCDDGNITDDDGCSSICRLESGYMCPGAGAPCARTTCGDGKREGTEQCDDGNVGAYDGCSPTCEKEPVCVGGTCSAVCGDGLKFPGEECDDGNTRDGDGCSKSCTLESGFACTVAVTEPPDALDLPVVYRDFLPNGYAGSIPDGYAPHPDFEQYNPGLCKGLLTSTLDATNKPTLRDGKACAASKVWMTSADSFQQWYRDGLTNADGKLVSQRIDATLTLTKRDDGSYVFDSNEAPYSSGKFFPLDDDGFGKEKNMRDGANAERNFHFTSELRYWFTYRSAAQATLDFRGDDDVWVFINNQLVVDLGGVHGATSGTVTLDDATATGVGLVDGGMYEIAVFQAERHTSASNYKLTLRGFERAHTSCASVCGDGVKTRSEACDDGTANNTGAYGKCKADCTFGPRCGDGVVQADEGEQCDDGNLVDGDGCSACKQATNTPK